MPTTIEERVQALEQYAEGNDSRLNSHEKRLGLVDSEPALLTTKNIGWGIACLAFGVILGFSSALAFKPDSGICLTAREFEDVAKALAAGRRAAK